MAHDGPKASDTYGYRKMDTEGLFKDVRRRVAPGLFKDVDREFRHKWLKAQELTAKEKAYHFFYLWDNPEYRKARLNPIRRIWQAPGEAFERALRPALGLQHAFVTKWLLGKSMWAVVGLWATAYYGMHNSGDRTRTGGWKARVSKPMTTESSPSFPLPDPKWERGTPDKYNSQGFDKNSTAIDIKPSLPVLY
uniref:Lethal 35Di n=1 Tax=Pseudodiaptomus poplesia TaxID=213370 RepID=A0A0U2USU1_9MAXI|nr:lethal 35Di [Pseudodiaptomus poplesia]